MHHRSGDGTISIMVCQVTEMYIYKYSSIITGECGLHKLEMDDREAAQDREGGWHVHQAFLSELNIGLYSEVIDIFDCFAGTTTLTLHIPT